MSYDEKEYKRQHYLDNKEKYKERAKKRYYKENKEKENKRCVKWKNENKDHIAQYQVDYRKTEHGRGMANFHNSKRRCKKLNATPKWSESELILEFYKNCPEGYTVDHIIPLQGKNVSGLHVIGNLQYLTKSENSKKGNHF